jgi:hypothetical protein
LVLKRKPFLGMNGKIISTTRHGGTAYGFGKEAAEATAEGADPG